MRRRTDGRTDLAMFDQMLDDLEAKRISLTSQLDAMTNEPTKEHTPAVRTAGHLPFPPAHCHIVAMRKHRHAGGDDLREGVNLVRTMI